MRSTRLRLLGRHRRDRHGRTIRSGRPRLLRHRAQAAAQHPAGARCRASASSCASSRRRRRRGLRRLRPHHRQRRRSTPASASSAPSTSSPTSTCAEPLRLARHGPQARRVHVRLREHRARLVPAPRLPVRARDLDLHRRVRRRPGRASASPRWRRTRRSPSASSCSRDFLGGHALLSNASHLRGSANWIRFPRVVCERWVTHGATVVLMGDAAHTAHFSIGSGTKLALEDAIELARPARPHRRRCAAALRDYEAARSVEVLRHPERGAQLDGVVRERRRATQHLTPSSSPTRCSRAASASATRTCACATPAIVDELEDWFARAGDRPGDRRRPSRRCSRRSRCAASTLKNRVVVSPMAHVLARRRHARRLPPRAPRRARAWAAPAWCSPR